MLCTWRSPQVAGEPAYDTLRTKQQLGYSVHVGTRLTHGALGFCVTVASGRVLTAGRMTNPNSSLLNPVQNLIAAA